MYAITSILLVRRTFATLRNAEFGFFGVVVYTRVQTPRFCGDCCSAGTFFLACCVTRGLRMSWLIVGIRSPSLSRRACALSPRRACALSQFPGPTQQL